MPELPEVETIARELNALVRGATVAQVHIRKSDVIREVSPATFRRRLVQARIENCWRRAKLAVLDLSSGDRIAVQPRFTGALLLETKRRPLPEGEARYSTLDLEFTDGRKLHYCDVRRLGTVALMSPRRFVQHSSSLGVEPLEPEFTPELLTEFMRGSRQAVKKLIMDQSKVVGVGNIYANEALWRARIDPSRAADRVGAEQAVELHGHIVEVLQAAIDARGTSFRDYRGASGDRGEFEMRLDAYGRGGKRCRRCGHKLIGTHAIDGRQTVLCAYCQR